MQLAAINVSAVVATLMMANIVKKENRTEGRAALDPLGCCRQPPQLSLGVAG